MEAKLRQERKSAKESGVDMAFLKKAREEEKTVIGLETMNEQLSAIDSWPVQEQATYVMESIRNPKEEGVDMMDIEETHRLKLNAYVLCLGKKPYRLPPSFPSQT